MTAPVERKKAFTHKVRTGCVKCRSRRIKCDEGKPECVRCQRRGHQCVYQTARAWIFEPGKATKTARRADLAALDPQPASPQNLCSVEEWQALQFFVSRTGPWMAEHQAVRAHGFWVVTLPRMFHAIPATRHLLTALGLLEMPTVTTDPAALEHRSQRITAHYVQALHEMTKPVRHAADITLSAILAWLLEAFMNHGPRAFIHSSAAQKLSYKDKKDIPQEELEVVLADVARARCQRFRCDISPTDASYILDAVTMRNQQTERPTAAHIRMQFEDYYQNVYPKITGQSQVSAAEAFISKWEAAILANVYRSDEPTVVWSSLHFLCVLSTHVLPIPPDVYFHDSEATEVGLEFALEKCELVLGLRIADHGYRRALLETARLMIFILISYTPREWQAGRVERLTRVACRCRNLLREDGEAQATAVATASPSLEAVQEVNASSTFVQPGAYLRTVPSKT